MKGLGSQKEVTMFYSKCARKPMEAIKQEMTYYDLCVSKPTGLVEYEHSCRNNKEAKRLVRRREGDGGGLGEHSTSGDGNKW